jgi:uncharacterized DUF497 family protein
MAAATFRAAACRWSIPGGVTCRLGPDRPLAYILRLEFAWDGARSDACCAARGFDFPYAIGVFLDPDRLVETDDRFDCGAIRWRVLDRIDGRVFAVICTPRHGWLRIISARKADRRDVNRHGRAARTT